MNSAVANLIREGKTHQIYSAIEVGAKFGMKSLDKDLARLVQEGTIDVEAAAGKANDPDAIKRLSGGAGS